MFKLSDSFTSAGTSTREVTNGRPATVATSEDGREICREVGVTRRKNSTPTKRRVACSKAVDPPPIEITFRESLIAAGKIVQIKNTSNEPIDGIEVTLTAPNGDERRFVQESLDGYGAFEIGWKKLGGWEIPPGTEVEVRVKGYLRPARGSIPVEALAAEG